MSDTVISVEGLSKRYALGAAEKASSFREAVSGVITAPFRRLRNLGSGGGTEEFWALKDVSFEVKRGEVVGVIGRNGAGKSTLLKVLSRITPPTSGRIRLKGRIASLLEVGTGFHPELTGRENIFLNGAILGMSSGEIRRKFDEIVAFSEVEKFLDTPVKRYSSGMYVRLAFAVAAHLEPEILIVDEVLAVGDAAFQKKCLGKMKEVSQGGGRTVLFVSHNMNAITALCDTALLIHAGTVARYGPSQDVAADYLGSDEPDDDVDLARHPRRSPRMRPILSRIRSFNASGQRSCDFDPDETVRLSITLSCPHKLLDPRIGIGFDNGRGERIFAVATYLSTSEVSLATGTCDVTVEFRLPTLIPGTYSTSLSVNEGPTHFLDQIDGASVLRVRHVNALGVPADRFDGIGHVLVPSRWQVVRTAERPALLVGEN